MTLVRLADPSRDARRVAEIYRPAVEQTHVSFEVVAPDQAEMARRMEAVLARTPWLVAEADGDVIGYAYAAPHRERAGYRWSIDLAVYVDNRWHGRGVGRTLYDELLRRVRQQGFVNAYAGICLPNDASVRLHESVGMTPVALYRRVGWKFDRWWDVAWYWLRLNEPPPGAPPPEPVPHGVTRPG